MSRFLKWTIIAGGSLAAALVLAVLLLPSMIEVERYRPLIERELSQALGRPVRLTGGLELSIFPWIGVETGPVSVENPAGFGEPRLVSMEAVEIRVAVPPLLRRAVEVNRFVLRSPEITLERTAEGRANWENIGPAEATPPPSEHAAQTEAPESDASEPQSAPDGPGDGPAISDLTVEELAIADGKLVWIDAAAGERREVSDLNLRVENLSFDQAISLNVSARLDGHPVEMNGEVGPLGNPPGTGTTPFSLAVKALDEIRAEISGDVADPTAATPAVNLTVSVSPFSPRQVFDRLSLDFPVSTADPDALGRVGLKGQFQGGPEAFTLSDGVLELDDARIVFSAALKDRDPLHLAADAQADALDVTRYLPAESAADPTTDSPRQPPPSTTDSAPTPDLSALEAAMLDLSFKADRLTLPELPLTDAGIQISGEKGRFDLDLSAQRDGRPLTLRGTVGPVTAERIDLDLTANALDLARAAVSGALRNPTDAPTLDALISVEPFDPRKLAEAVGVSFPAQTADPAALGRLGFSGKVRGGPKSLRVDNGELILDETTAQFQMNAAAFSPPNLTVNLGLDRINLDRYLPPSRKSGAESAEKKTEDGSDAPPAAIDYDPLRRMRIDGTFRAEALTIRGLDLTGIRLKIFGEEGIFRLDPLDVNLYRGAMSLAGRTDVNGPEPASRADLSIRGVALGPLLADAGAGDLLSGRLNASANFSAQGDQPDRITRSLDGTADLRLSDGRVKGLNLVNMARNIETAFRSARGEEAAAETGTEFTELTAAATVENGSVAIKEGRLTSPVLEADAGGNLHLAERTLDIRVTPTFIQPVGGRNAVAVPVVIGGTFDKPTYRPDLENLIQIDPRKTVDAILKDPKKGVKDLLKEQEERIRSILTPGREESPAAESGSPKENSSSSEQNGSSDEPSEEDAKSKQEDKKPSAEDAVRNLLRSLPLGN
ncbi:MAG: AsmA family protein [Desulfococcaceae bacterium]